jgi:RND family efflux transporter MFP subunit
MSQVKQSSWLFLLLLIAITGVTGWQVAERYTEVTSPSASKKDKTKQPVPVEIARVTRGDIDRVRSFSGTLEARAEFVVAPKVDGRIERLTLDVADGVQRGQIVAHLDNAEFIQDEKQAEAELAVAEANLAEARSLAAIADREMARIERLREQGISSESQRDAAHAEQLARQAHVEVSKAEIARARAALESARIRLGYSAIRADWNAGADSRIVAERFVDEGETVSANTPLLHIVELDPIKAVIHVSEKDYGFFESGQNASLRTDAFPGLEFDARIERIAPVFLQNTRQARIELLSDNPDLRLKPGMFALVEVILERARDVLLIPHQALVKREDQFGVFVLSEDNKKVRWALVRTAIEQGGRIQVEGAIDAGDRVVTLGQQLLKDGSNVRVTNADATS